LRRLRAKKYRPLEKEVQKECLAYLHVLGIDCQRRNTAAFVVKNENGKRRFVQCGQPGDSDISGMLPDGRKFDCEIKRPGNRPTQEQYARLHKTNAGNGVGLWVDNVDSLITHMPKILAGARVEIDDDGECWIVTED
jgi:hypothetical protein